MEICGKCSSLFFSQNKLDDEKPKKTCRRCASAFSAVGKLIMQNSPVFTYKKEIHKRQTTSSDEKLNRVAKKQRS